MPAASEPGKSEDRTKWHSAGWWAAVGGIAAVAALFIPMMSPQAPAVRPPETAESQSPSVASTPSSSPITSTNPPKSPLDAAIAPPSVPPSNTGLAPGAAKLYLSNLPPTAFIRQEPGAFRGAVRSNGLDYPFSYSFEFHNCSNCTSTTEVNIPSTFSRFQGVLALTDDTRHDSIIDGTVFFSVTATDGSVLLPSQRVEYPANIPFDIDVSGISRVRLVVSAGTNWELPCWCNAVFVK